MKKVFLVVAMLTLLCLIEGCKEEEKKPQPPPAESVMVLVEGDAWPDLADDLDRESLLSAVDQSLKYLGRLPPERIFHYGRDEYTAAHLVDSLTRFKELVLAYGLGPELRKVLAEEYLLYQSAGRDTERTVLVTGYYEPLLNGSLRPTGNYVWPIYGRPKDLIDVDLGLFDKELKGHMIRGRLDGRKLVPYFSRREIDRQGALMGRELELLWIDDPVALFFLHIQGSGRVRLEDGRIIRVGYAGANGRAYRSLGKHMIEKEILPREGMSMQAIRKWLLEHPREMYDILDINESYVFFRELEGEPVGNINVPLTPNRSIALDHRIFPKGSLAWLKSSKPRLDGGRFTGMENFSRYVMVQDTGGAIRGPGRVDLFFGHGRNQEAQAGRMKEKGSLYFLVRKLEY